MTYSQDELLMLSNIQHFSFCKRQWSFIVVESQWVDNRLTVEGTNIHKTADDPVFVEVRNDIIISRAVPIVSYELGLSGKCDVVEFHPTEKGIRLSGKAGTYTPVPVEYKHGSKKTNDVDEVQLCAQGLCLEEMLNVNVPFGYMYYHKTRRRVEIRFTEILRARVKKLCVEMHDALKCGKTFSAELKNGCKNCSFYDLCLPESFSKNSSVKSYMDAILNFSEEER